jgi:hypothetical protein
MQLSGDGGQRPTDVAVKGAPADRVANLKFALHCAAACLSRPLADFTALFTGRRWDLTGTAQIYDKGFDVTASLLTVREWLARPIPPAILPCRCAVGDFGEAILSQF